MSLDAAVAMLSLLHVTVLGGFAFFRWHVESVRESELLWLSVGIVSGATTLCLLQFVGIPPLSANSELDPPHRLIACAVVNVVGYFSLRAVLRATALIRMAAQIVGSTFDHVGHIRLEELSLTRRETQVLEAIGDGLLTDKQLAEFLFISASTAHTHVNSLLHKSGLHRRQDLVVLLWLRNLHR